METKVDEWHYGEKGAPVRFSTIDSDLISSLVDSQTINESSEKEEEDYDKERLDAIMWLEAEAFQKIVHIFEK